VTDGDSVRGGAPGSGFLTSSSDFRSAWPRRGVLRLLGVITVISPAEETPTMKNIRLTLDDDLHRRLRLACVEESKVTADVIDEAVRAHLAERDRKKAAPEATG
jgi:hypothetical protein